MLLAALVLKVRLDSQAHKETGVPRALLDLQASRVLTDQSVRSATWENPETVAILANLDQLDFEDLLVRKANLACLVPKALKEQPDYKVHKDFPVWKASKVTEVNEDPLDYSESLERGEFGVRPVHLALLDSKGAAVLQEVEVHRVLKVLLV